MAFRPSHASTLLATMTAHFQANPKQEVVVWIQGDQQYAWGSPHHIDGVTVSGPEGHLRQEISGTLRTLGCPSTNARQGLVAWRDEKGVHLHLYHSRLGSPSVKDHATEVPIGEDETFRLGYPVTEQWALRGPQWQEVSRHANTHQEAWDPVVTLPTGVPRGAEGFIRKAMTDAMEFPDFTASQVRRMGMKVDPGPPVAMQQVDNLFMPRRRRP